MNSFVPCPVVHWDGAKAHRTHLDLVGESPLTIYLQDRIYRVEMRTPGDEIAHAVGFCLSRGIVAKPDDFSAIQHAPDDPDTVRLTLSADGLKSANADPQAPISGLLRFDDHLRLNPASAFNRLIRLGDFQKLREKTGASHAAAIFNDQLELMALAEDVGRHNALDKAIGKLFLENNLGRARLLVLSSRISFELVQKAARARIPVVFSMSRPTSLAVKTGVELNMTLACLSRKEGLFIFCGKERLSL
ncbi:MAG: formate dehydrogenase accessory sulfurtransferase FdhD [Desulfobacterales bacterium]